MDRILVLVLSVVVVAAPLASAGLAPCPDGPEAGPRADVAACPCCGLEPGSCGCCEAPARDAPAHRMQSDCSCAPDTDRTPPAAVDGPPETPLAEAHPTTGGDPDVAALSCARDRDERLLRRDPHPGFRIPLLV